MEIKPPISNVSQEKFVHSLTTTLTLARSLAPSHSPSHPPTHSLTLSPAYTHARSDTHAFELAPIYTYMHAYSPGPVAQFAARQICNLSPIQGTWYRTHVQPNHFRGDWSWDSFYSHSLSTTESSKAKCVLFVMFNCLGGLRMSRNSMCRLTGRVRHYLNSVYLAVKRQSNKIHTY